MNMFHVDGLLFENFPQAEVVANRLYKRYGGWRTILIIDHDGEVVRELKASSEPDTTYDGTTDWIDT
jgi:hypothetical protein